MNVTLAKASAISAHEKLFSVVAEGRYKYNG